MFTKTEFSKLIKEMPRFEIIERVKGHLYYVIRRNLKTNKVHDSLGWTVTKGGAKKRIAAYCKQNEIENYLTSLIESKSS